MIHPTPLKKGDKVALVCTARSFSKKDAQPAVDLLKSWDLITVFGETIDKDDYELGGSDDERATDLQKMINNPEIKAIWIARGGYGTVRIIDRIGLEPLKKHPKWIIGFSDITTLHNTLHQNKLSSIHGIMPFSVAKASEEAKNSLKNILFNQNQQYKATYNKNNKLGIAEGEIVGGNLSIIYSLLGSKSSINTDNKILFIEDLDEYLYHIDRMMQNLKRNNYFDKLNGLIIGGMTDMHKNQIPFGFNEKELILDVIKEYNFPVCFDFPAGHIANNQSLHLGKKVKLTCSEKGSELIYI